MIRNIDLVWFKNSYSSSEGDSCVQIATTPATVHIRDSKHTEGPRLAVASAAWADFVTFASGS
jgi:hypothetical protein